MNLSRLLPLNRLTISQNHRQITATCNRLMSSAVKEAQSTITEKSKFNGPRQTDVPSNYRFIYPEFLPDPDMKHRHLIREKIERYDMLDRRMHVDIPEFYVGSIMAVTRNDRHASGKTGRFLGICIDRMGCGLRSQFILRNVVDHQGVEVLYEMYDPTIEKVEVLRLEKRLDDHLYYLRDALPEYSTFAMDMEPEMHIEGEPIPINPTQVQLRPRPWLQRWERQNLQGVSNLFEVITSERYLRKQNHPQVTKVWEKYDLMKMYRSTIPAEEQEEIFGEIYPKLQSLQSRRKKVLRQRSFVKPSKVA